MELQNAFRNAVEAAEKLPRRPSNEDLLRMYGLYKQATEGDISGDRPGGFDFKAIAKFDAWAEQKGKSKEEAMQTYINFIEKLQNEL